MPTIPVRCATVTAATATAAGYIAAWHTFLTVGALGDFSVVNTVGAPVTSFTLQHADGWQVNYRLTGDQVLKMFAPDGGISDSASPGTPTNASPEEIGLPVASGSGTSLNCAIYDDAVLCLVKNSAGDAHTYVMHDGVVGTPTRASHPARGLDGKAILGYIPSPTASNVAQLWFSTAGAEGSRQSKIRIGPGAWSSPGLTRALATVTTDTVLDRFSPAEITAGDGDVAPTTNQPLRLIAKYIAQDGGASSVPLTVTPSATSDQAWLKFNSTSAATRMCCLWDKNVIP